MSLYGRWMHRRERILTRKDPHRRVFPFEWGTEWLADFESIGAPLPPGFASGMDDQEALKCFLDFGRWALDHSGQFFSTPKTVVDSSGPWLEFESPLPTFARNGDRVRCRVFPSPGAERAVIVTPQWNADENSHVALCRLLQRFGFTVVRQVLPYHEERRPEGMVRADHMVSPNIGRTLHAVRQAVVELRVLARALRDSGFERIGVVGSSIGSCVSYLAFVHDPLIRAGVFNHVSAYFADVVWKGLATRYVRRGLEGHLSLDDLRRIWGPVSPLFHIPALVGDSRPHLMLSARYDLTFLPELSRRVFDEYRNRGIHPQVAYLPCGHYATARFPYSWMAGWHICRFLLRHLNE